MANEPQVNPEWEKRKAAAEQELSEVCQKHEVNVIPYLDAFGPKLTIVDAQIEKPQNSNPGSQPDTAGDGSSNPAPAVPKRADANNNSRN